MWKNKLSGIILLGFTMLIFSSCGSDSQKSNKNPDAKENVISEELHQAQCDLLAKANEDLAIINQKVRDLNDKIRTKNEKLTDAQNASLDEFEQKQASINKRMHEIKSVKEEDWESFKASLEKDLDDIKNLIDGISNEL